jgi:hypothetical protein
LKSKAKVLTRIFLIEIPNQVAFFGALKPGRWNRPRQNLTSGRAQGISDIITTPGLVNVDFADVKAIMANSGTAMLGVGASSSRNRAEEAALQATSAPLIEVRGLTQCEK